MPLNTIIIEIPIRKEAHKLEVATSLSSSISIVLASNLSTMPKDGYNHLPPLPCASHWCASEVVEIASHLTSKHIARKW
jgi:hypothetical protein